MSSAPSRSGTGHARHGGDKVRHRPVTASLASARPPWPAHSPRATGVAMHVDPRDALIPHLHTRPPPAAAPSDWDRRAAGQSPRPVQETDTRARSSSGGYPGKELSEPTCHAASNGPSGNGHDRRQPLRACTLQPRAAPQIPQTAPARHDPHPPAAAKDPVSIPHGRATQWLMISTMSLEQYGSGSHAV